MKNAIMRKVFFFFAILTTGIALLTSFTIIGSTNVNVDPNTNSVIDPKAEEDEMSTENLIKAANDARIAVEEALARIERRSHSKQKDSKEKNEGGQSSQNKGDKYTIIDEPKDEVKIKSNEEGKENTKIEYFGQDKEMPKIQKENLINEEFTQDGEDEVPIEVIGEVENNNENQKENGKINEDETQLMKQGKKGNTAGDEKTVPTEATSKDEAELGNDNENQKGNDAIDDGDNENDSEDKEQATVTEDTHMEELKDDNNYMEQK